VVIPEGTLTRVGVLALQGDVREHRQLLEAVGALVTEVRRPSDLDRIDVIVLPGGESTTIGRLATIFGLLDPLGKAISDGLPTYGSCAGMILLAKGTTGDRQPQLGAMDVIVERNAFGRQNESFEVDLDIAGLEKPFHAVFIRAPWVASIGEGVEVLAEVEGHPVMIRQGNVIATSFHPELTGDDRIHRMVLDLVGAGSADPDGATSP
jgi:pyridoxal 5'-phosphate synthase pdxT subunit